LAVLVLAGRLSAQAPRQGAGSSSPSAVTSDEIRPRVLSSPDGQVFRLWQRFTEFQKGGGGVLLALASASGTWEKLLELLPSEPGVTALEADLAFGSAKEMALAYQWRRHSPRTKQIRVARSDDGGRTWTQSSPAIESSGKGFTPKVAWGQGRSLVVVWADERRADKAWDVYSRRSPDGGSTWEPEQRLSRFPHQTLADLAASPELMSDGRERFWSVWIGLLNGFSNFYLSRSIDGGRSWTDPMSLTSPGGSVFGARFVRSGERLLLLWQDNRTGQDRIYAVSSDDGGVTWSPPTRVDHIPPDSTTSASSPAVVLDRDAKAFAVWQDGRNGRDDIFFGRSMDGGRTWEAEDTRLDMDEAGTAVSRFPAIAMAEDGRLAVAWEDDRAGHEGVYLRIRASGQSPSWGPEVIVAPPALKKAARTPSLVWSSSGALYVAWQVLDFTLGSSTITNRVESRVLFLDKK
jgi:hypothetical protein